MESVCSPAWVVLGAITRPHGVRGQVKVRLYSESGKLFETPSVVLLAADRAAVSVGSAARLAITEIRAVPGGAIVALEGVCSREQADALRGLRVCIERCELEPLDDPEQFYAVDLLGLSVRDEHGTDLGVVQDVIDYPSVTCLRVHDREGAFPAREVPLVEDFVARVDLEEGLVVVRDFGTLPEVP